MLEAALATLFLSLVGNLYCAFAVQRSLPGTIVRDHKLIRAEVERVASVTENLQTRWASKVVELEALADTVTADVERAETKRRRADASARRAAGPAKPEEDPDSDAALWKRAQAAGCA